MYKYTTQGIYLVNNKKVENFASLNDNEFETIKKLAMPLMKKAQTFRESVIAFESKCSPDTLKEIKNKAERLMIDYQTKFEKNNSIKENSYEDLVNIIDYWNKEFDNKHKELGIPVFEQKEIDASSQHGVKPLTDEELGKIKKEFEPAVEKKDNIGIILIKFENSFRPGVLDNIKDSFQQVNLEFQKLNAMTLEQIKNLGYDYLISRRNYFNDNYSKILSQLSDIITNNRIIN